MNINKKTLIEVLETEIKWCKKNKSESNKSKNFVSGFIKGLKQSIFIIKKFK